MKKALIRSQGSLINQSKLIVDYKPLESYCPELIPENKKRIVIYVWDCRIQKAKKHYLAIFLDSTIESMINTRNLISAGVKKQPTCIEKKSEVRTNKNYRNSIKRPSRIRTNDRLI